MLFSQIEVKNRSSLCSIHRKYSNINAEIIQAKNNCEIIKFRDSLILVISESWLEQVIHPLWVPCFRAFVDYYVSLILGSPLQFDLNGINTSSETGFPFATFSWFLIPVNVSSFHFLVQDSKLLAAFKERFRQGNKGTGSRVPLRCNSSFEIQRIGCTQIYTLP